MAFPRIHARVTANGQAFTEASAPPLPVVNLSVGGCMLKGAAEPGSLLDVEIQVDGTDAFRVSGHVVRREELPDGTPAFAIAFQDVTEEEDKQLTRAVIHGFKALGARILGQVRADLARAGVTEVGVVAAELHRIREEQAQKHMFSADLFTERGSDTVASIVSGTTGESRECIVWSLNLYLGLNRNPRVIEKTRAATLRYGTGCGTSAPSGGHNTMHREIETRVAKMVGMEKAILFPTGYTTNLGALSALAGPKDLILLDREAHASMIDGVKLSGKKWLAFKHNDVADLAEKLKKYSPHHENVFVAVESVYSMSGDLAPLREIAALKKDFKFYLYVDEAHSFGFYGPGGGGYSMQCGVTDQVDFMMSTFSKATASVGGFFAAKAQFCTLLQATATPYIFQACLTPPDAATILACLDEIESDPGLLSSLHDKNAEMRRKLIAEGFDLGTSQSPVIPVYVPDLEKLYNLCARLYLNGVYSVPVVFPAVGVNEGRIRFIVNAAHTSEQIDRTVKVLADNARALGVLRPRTLH